MDRAVRRHPRTRTLDSDQILTQVFKNRTLPAKSRLPMGAPLMRSMS